MNTTKLWQAQEDPVMPKAKVIMHTERVGWGMGAVGRGEKTRQRGQDAPAVYGALERSTEHLVS